MGLIDLINSIGASLRDFASSNTEFTCSQCLKCKQCIKSLEDGTQVRVFACPAYDDNIPDDEYLNSMLPSLENGLTEEYLKAYNDNREAIFNNLYNSDILYTESTKPICNEDYFPITTFNELKYYYKAMECPYFRAFINSDNVLTDNDKLSSDSFPNIVNFASLSKEDKQRISQRYDW